jgi:hypothetical protein
MLSNISFRYNNGQTWMKKAPASCLVAEHPVLPLLRTCIRKACNNLKPDNLIKKEKPPLIFS